MIFEPKTKILVADAPINEYHQIGDDGKVAKMLFLFPAPGPDSLPDELRKLIGYVNNLAGFKAGKNCRIRAVVDRSVETATDFARLRALLGEWLKEENDKEKYETYVEGINAHTARYPFVQCAKAVSQSDLDAFQAAVSSIRIDID